MKNVGCGGEGKVKIRRYVREMKSGEKKPAEEPDSGDGVRRRRSFGSAEETGSEVYIGRRRGGGAVLEK